jgi:hypothetical protein
MCFAVFSPSDDSKIHLRFAHERILLKRHGGFRIEADLLIENVGVLSISLLRLLIPYSLVDGKSVATARSEAKCEQRLERLRESQLSCVQLLTSQLSSAKDDSHWIYNLTLAHLNIDSRSEEGVFCIKRYHPESAADMGPVQGFIKSSWKVRQPNGLSNLAWGLHNVNGLTVLDVVRSGNHQQENLQPRETMWLRVRIDVDQENVNGSNFLRRIFASAREYRQEFRTPKLIASETVRHLEQFQTEKLFNLNLAHIFTVQRKSAREFLPEISQIPPVDDWRTFLFREEGLGLISQKGIGVREKEGVFTLPATSTVRRLLRCPPGNRRDTVVEAFFGKEFGDDSDGDPVGSMTVKSRYRNPLYGYMTWINLLLTITALVLSILALW